MFLRLDLPHNPLKRTEIAIKKEAGEASWVGCPICWENIEEIGAGCATSTIHSSSFLGVFPARIQLHNCQWIPQGLLFIVPQKIPSILEEVFHNFQGWMFPALCSRLRANCRRALDLRGEGWGDFGRYVRPPLMAGTRLVLYLIPSGKLT